MILRVFSYAVIFLSFLYAILHAFYADVQAIEILPYQIETVEDETLEVQIESERVRLQTYELMKMVERAERSCDDTKISCTQLADF